MPAPLLDGGSKILISSSSGGCALVERPSGKAIWYAQVPNAHSLELLPRGRIIVASSVHAQGNRLVLFDLDHSDQPIWGTPLVSAHGVVRERASRHRPDGLCPGHRVLVERYRGAAFAGRHDAIAGGAVVQSEMAASGWIALGFIHSAQSENPTRYYHFISRWKASRWAVICC
jgi:hypothetical protein